MTAETRNPNIQNISDTAPKLQVRRFLAECTVRNLDDTDVLPVADLYGMYIIWCEQAGTRHLPVHTFSALTQEEGISSGTSRRERVFKGVLATGAIPIQYILETDKSPGPNSPLEHVLSIDSTRHN